MAITTRAGKGSPLTHPEMDTNLTDLRDGVNIMLPKTKGVGVKVDSLGAPTFPWRNLDGSITRNETGPGSPNFVAYRGGVKQIQFDVNDELTINYLFPHDYAPNTDIYIDLEWSHNSALVTGGSVSWTFERCFAQGANQSAFSVPLSLVFNTSASLVPYRPVRADMRGFAAGGSPTEFDTALLGPDSMVIGRLVLTANNITVSGGQPPRPFIHRLGVQYQSTNIGTKQRAPDFWT